MIKKLVFSIVLQRILYLLETDWGYVFLIIDFFLEHEKENVEIIHVQVSNLPLKTFAISYILFYK